MNKNSELPVVGKRYRSKLRVEGCEYELIEVMYIKPTNTGTCHILWIDPTKFSTMTGSEYLEDFWKRFEELPEDKAETNATGIKDKNGHEIHVGDFIKRGRLQGIVKFFDDNDGKHYFITDEKEGDCGIMAWESNKLEIIVDPFKARWSGEKFEIKFSEDGDKICATLSDFINLQESPAGFGDDREEALVGLIYSILKSKIETKPETQSPELSPEVKEAMEELEDYFCRSLIDSNDIIAAMQHYRELKDKTKNLLNALDKQFNQPSESGDVKEEEVSKNDKVANQTLQEKEESIWKPVSELPELAEGDTMDCFIRSDKGDVAKSCFYKREDEIGHAPCGFEEKEEKEYCSLTDFINDYEKLKERVRKLEETKLNK